MRAFHRTSGLVLALAAALAALTAGCARRRPVAVPPAARAPRVGDVETGVASWYGHPYHGRAAANGEIYDMDKMTAAHRTLPFETWVRVTNVGNQRSVEVRITDRGPFVKNRIIDLSRAAAVEIGMIVDGTAKVRVEVRRLPGGVFTVQAGVFRDRANAEKLRAALARDYPAARLSRVAAADRWRVLVGRESTREQAEALARRLHGEGKAGIVIRDPD